MNPQRRLPLSCWLAAAAVGLVVNSPCADIPAFTATGSGGSSSSFTGTRGWQFTRYYAQDIFVTQLGVFDSGGDGLVSSHEVGLWSEAGARTLLASVTVPAGTAAPLVGGFRWVSIDPVRISGTAPLHYYLGAAYAAGDADAKSPSTSVFQFAPDIAPYVMLGGVRGYGPGLPFPGDFNPGPQGSPGEYFWEPNLMYSYTVPEPSVCGLLSCALGYALWRARRSGKHAPGFQNPLRRLCPH